MVYRQDWDRLLADPRLTPHQRNQIHNDLQVAGPDFVEWRDQPMPHTSRIAVIRRFDKDDTFYSDYVVHFDSDTKLNGSKKKVKPDYYYAFLMHKKSFTNESN